MCCKLYLKNLLNLSNIQGQFKVFNWLNSELNNPGVIYLKVCFHFLAGIETLCSCLHFITFEPLKKFIHGVSWGNNAFIFNQHSNTPPELTHISQGVMEMSSQSADVKLFFLLLHDYTGLRDILKQWIIRYVFEMCVSCKMSAVTLKGLRASGSQDVL